MKNLPFNNKMNEIADAYLKNKLKAKQEEDSARMSNDKAYLKAWDEKNNYKEKSSSSAPMPNIAGGGSLKSAGLSTAMAGNPVAGGAIAGLGVISDIAKKRAELYNLQEKTKYQMASDRLDRIQTSLAMLSKTRKYL